MKPYQHGYGAEARSAQAPKMSHTEKWEEHHREGRFFDEYGGETGSIRPDLIYNSPGELNLRLS